MLDLIRSIGQFEKKFLLGFGQEGHPTLLGRHIGFGNFRFLKRIASPDSNFVLLVLQTKHPGGGREGVKNLDLELRMLDDGG